MKKIIAFTIVILVLTTPLFAVEIEPLRIEVSASQGKTSTVIIKATNWFDYSVKINAKPDTYRYIFTENSVPPSEGGTPAEGGGLPSCKDWLTLEPSEFELGPQASMYIKCIINAPEDANKEHVASIMFDEEGLVTTYEKFPQNTGNITLSVVPRLTIPVYVTIKGYEATSAEISDIKVKEGPNLGTIKIEATLYNKGTVHLRPSGNVAFMDSLGNIVRTLVIGECLPIFPYYKEKIPVYYPDLIEPGEYTVVCTIDIGKGKLLQKKTSFTITKDYELE